MQGKVETRVGIFILAALAIFIYMGFQIGSFRFDRGKYNKYTISFNDISGLSKKAEVTIAGVKVGWVENITLLPDEMQAEANVMVLKEYTLYSDSHAIVRQDGLLGPKYIELVPGDPLLSPLKAGQMLSHPSIEPVNVDELLQKFRVIAENVEEVTGSIKDAVGGYEGRDQIRSIFSNLNETAEQMATVSRVLERSLVGNEDNIDSILDIGNQVRRITDSLQSDLFPAFQEGIQKVSNVIDRDFNRIATRLESTAIALEDASLEAREGLKNVSSVAEKIDEGRGLIGKLINEDETYQDLKVAVGGLRNYFAKIDTTQVVFDTHVESMHRPAEHYEYEDSKGYLEVRIHPNEDHFYLLQLTASEKGFIYRQDYLIDYEDKCGNLVNTDKLCLTDNNRLENVFDKRSQWLVRNTVKVGLQFGKIFGDIAFRVGLFEGSAGMAVDFDIPINSEKFRWVTTMEAFDFRGWNRVNDRRPHLKWINRMFFLQNIYLAFGADDFVSKRNANAFFGAGIRFGDDDAKYLMAAFSGNLGTVLDNVGPVAVCS